MMGGVVLCRALGLPLALAAGVAFAADMPPPQPPYEQRALTPAAQAEAAWKRLQEAKTAEATALDQFDRALQFRKSVDGASARVTATAQAALDQAQHAHSAAQTATRQRQTEYDLLRAAADRMPPATGPATLRTRPVPAPQKLVEAALERYVLPPNPAIGPLIMDALTAGKGDPKASALWLEAKLMANPANKNGQEALSYLHGMKESEAEFGRFSDRISLLGTIPVPTQTPSPAPGSKPWELNRVLKERDDVLRAAARDSDGTPESLQRAMERMAQKDNSQATRNAVRYLHGYLIYYREASK